MRFESHGLKGGIWSGMLTADTAPARVLLAHLGQAVAEAELRPEGDGWQVRVPVPADILSDGRHSLILLARPAGGASEAGNRDVRLDRLDLIAGAALDEDLAAEIQALRAEMELLKREFRRLAADG